MKQNYSQDFLKQYNALMFAVKMEIYRNGTQKQVAEYLGIDRSNLSKILSGTIPCSSRFFFRLLNYAGFDIVKYNGVPEPTFVSHE